MNYYPFHVGDYTSHTAHLEPMEDLAYRRLMDLYYTTESPLPSATECARLIRMKAFLNEVAGVLTEFFHETPAGWVSDRCEHEIAAYREKQTKASASGKASAIARQLKNERILNERSTNVQRTFNERSTNEEQPLSERSTTRTITRTITKEENLTASPSALPASKKGSRLSPDFALTAELRDFCLTTRPDLSPEVVFETFRDYWLAQPGAKGCKLDWVATWRNWVRNSRTSNTRSAASEIARAMEMIN